MSFSRASVVGVGESRFGRGLSMSADELIVEAARAAAADAGMAFSDIDAVIPCGSVFNADEIATALGIDRKFTASPGVPAGAGPLAGVALAAAVIGAGLAETVLIYYGYVGSKPGGPYGYHAKDPVKASLEMPFGWYGQPVYFAAWAQRYCHEHGIAPEELGAIAMSNRRWAELTPGAQKRTPMTTDDYLASRMIASPLRAADCCLISDGAGAVIMTSVQRARDICDSPVVLAGAGVSSTESTMTSFFTQKQDMGSFGSARTGPIAFGTAEMSVADIDVAQIYDCFSISQVIQLEDLGFCGRGEAVALHAQGHTSPGGSIPVNTHGGHLSYAYIPGIVHVIEGIRQLRGIRGAAQVDNAETALVAALGGPEHVTLIFSKDR